MDQVIPASHGSYAGAELCRVRGWDKNLPSRLLGALPKRSWIKRLRRLGLEVLVPLWRHAASKSEATRSRYSVGLVDFMVKYATYGHDCAELAVR